MQSGQAIELFQITPYVSDFQTPNNPGYPDSLHVGAANISFTFHFWHNSFLLDNVKLAELSNNSFEWKNVTFLWGSKRTLTDPCYIFSGDQDPNLPGSTLLLTYFLCHFQCRI